MGWGRTFLLGNFGTRMDVAECEKMIEELYREATRKNRINHSQDDRIAELEKENGELKLYLAVLFRVLVSKEVFDLEEFRRLVEVIDREDGKADGQFDGNLT